MNSLRIEEQLGSIHAEDKIFKPLIATKLIATTEVNSDYIGESAKVIFANNKIYVANTHLHKMDRNFLTMGKVAVTRAGASGKANDIAYLNGKLYLPYISDAGYEQLKMYNESNLAILKEKRPPSNYYGYVATNSTNLYAGIFALKYIVRLSPDTMDIIATSPVRTPTAGVGIIYGVFASDKYAYGIYWDGDYYRLVKYNKDTLALIAELQVNLFAPVAVIQNGKITVTASNKQIVSYNEDTFSPVVEINMQSAMTGSAHMNPYNNDFVSVTYSTDFFLIDTKNSVVYEQLKVPSSNIAIVNIGSEKYCFPSSGTSVKLLNVWATITGYLEVK